MSISTTTTTDQFLSTPGEILKEEFLEPLGISNYRLAKTIGVGETAIGEIVRGKRTISTAMAYRLAAALGTTPEFWMNLQRGLRLAQLRHQYPRRYQTSDSRVSLRDNVMTRTIDHRTAADQLDRHAGRQPGQRHPGLPPCRGTRRGHRTVPEMWSNGYALPRPARRGLDGRGG